MKVNIRDANSLAALRPLEVASYLRASDWKQSDFKEGQYAVWTLDDDAEAFLPLRSTTSDYALRMSDLLTVLSTVENRSQLDIYSDLLRITSDVVRIRIADAELIDGTLPIEENAQIAQKARDLILAAACATKEKRAVWHKRKPADAMEHVRRVRIGQSERGSYVITVMTRVTPELGTRDGQLFEPVTPFDRRVTQTLAQSLSALARAAEQSALSRQLDAFDGAISRGVNANLCDAVVGLWGGGDEVQRNLEFSFSWSPTRLVAKDEVTWVNFTSDRVPLIREAGQLLRKRAPLTEFKVSGPVFRLEREEGATVGKVTVIGIVDDRPVRIALELGDPEYQTAVACHGEGRSISVYGTLQRDGCGYVLNHPSDFSIREE
jgi:hypothetical protein